MNLHPDCFCNADWFAGKGKYTCDYCKNEQFKEAVRPLKMNVPADVEKYKEAKVKYLNVKK